MRENAARYCDVSLPVPLHCAFTYELPLTLGHSARPGCRVVVPFGSGRNLTGVVLKTHDDSPSHRVRDVLRVIDAEPVLDGELLQLGNWIAEYYCAPLGEVLKSMLPLSGETRRSVRYSLTRAGRDAARQLIVRPESDAAVKVLSILEQQPRSAAYFRANVREARSSIKRLLERGWVSAEQEQETRHPLRVPAERLQAEFICRSDPGAKLKKNERELLAFLELHPGPHNLGELRSRVRKASEAARGLARRELIRLAPAPLVGPQGFERPIPVLNPQQQKALDQIAEALRKNEFASFLLEGVTGSGKTEVYLRSIEAALSMGKNALLLVPEIALTPAMAGQFFHRFDRDVAILHSAFGDTERTEQWRRIRSGQARVVVGTRSGVFAPVQRLGLIIVDEEHDTSYKQQETPRYHGRDVALMRAKNSGAVAILGSATPSVETRYNGEQGKYTMLRLPDRIEQRPLPEVEIVDMRLEFLETKRQAMFSRKLLEQIEQRLANGEQTMLLLNRRGFSNFMVCRACGERLECANCAVVLTHHKRDRRMLCHYCGYSEKIPSHCPNCGSDHTHFLGSGSERVEEELHRHFPDARVARLDRDSARGKGMIEQILHSFHSGETDILAGTQMIAKGHDIPNVTLVGVVLADIGLGMPDFRAAERSFQLLTQAAGRAGRGTAPGRVIIQTLNPDHYAVRFAAQHDYDGFYKKELAFRKWLRYPPFAALASVLVRAQKQEDALRLATQLGFILTPPPEGVRVMGPAEAPVLKLKNEFRYQILLKGARRPILRNVLQQLRQFAEKEKWSATALAIDVDPISLM
ncbi:MAG: primosomal protein N' [Acidobacteriaceae bacterium]|nr:primosomal protein N' [Acidobacteriaceae bacterium]MBV9781493.1 primosomal protein N' [Acidobacteriaceae bacterium]